MSKKKDQIAERMYQICKQVWHEINKMGNQTKLEKELMNVMAEYKEHIELH